MGMNKLSIAVASAIITVSMGSMQAAPLVSYNFSVANPGVDSTPTSSVLNPSASYTATGVTATALAINSGIVSNSGSNGNKTGVNDWPTGTYGGTSYTAWQDYDGGTGVFMIAASQLSTNNTIDTTSTKWFGFSATISSAQDLGSLTFAVEMIRNNSTSGTGAGRVGVSYSVDNGATFNVLTFTGTGGGNTYYSVPNSSNNNHSWTLATIDLSNEAALQDFTGTVQFRWFMTTNNASNTYRSMVFDDITLSTAVPEAASLTMLGMGGLVLLGRSRRK